jgi:hypothetical protein
VIGGSTTFKRLDNYLEIYHHLGCVLRASLTEPVNPAGTELFQRIYGFEPNRVQNRARKHGPACKISSGARETSRTPRIKSVRRGEFGSQTLLPSAVPLPTRRRVRLSSAPTQSGASGTRARAHASGALAGGRTGGSRPQGSSRATATLARAPPSASLAAHRACPWRRAARRRTLSAARHRSL